MSKKIHIIGKHALLLCLEGVAVLALLVLLAGGVLVWRLGSGPLDVGFAREYIEDSLYDFSTGYSVALNTVGLVWPDTSGPVMLDLGGMQLLKDGQPVLEIEKVALGLAGMPLLTGSVEPSHIILTGPSLRLIRNEDNQVTLGVEGETFTRSETENAAPESESALMRIVHRLSQSQDGSGEASPLDHLQSLEIKDARMVMEDHVLGITWFLPHLDTLFSRDDAGLVVSFAIDLPGGHDQASNIRADIVYTRNSDDFKFHAHVQDFDPHIISRKIEALAMLNDHDVTVNGDIYAVLDSEFRIKTAQLSLVSDEGVLSLPDLYDEPLPYEQIVFDAGYDYESGVASLDKFSMTARDVTVALSTKARYDREKNALDAPVLLAIDDLPQERIAALWPDTLRGLPVEAWLTQRLSKGRLHDIAVRFDVSAQRSEEESWIIAANNITADFGLTDMDVDYRAPLMPVKAATGKGHFSGDVLAIDIAKGKLADMAVTAGRVEIDHIIGDGVGEANIDVALNGPLRDVFKYIGPEPIGMSAEKLGFDPAQVDGRAALDINVNFPTSKDLRAEQVKVTVKGTLNDVLLPGVVKDMALTGGPLALTVKGGTASLKGNGVLDGRPVALTWEQYLDLDGAPYDSRITAQMKADFDFRQKLGIGLEDWVAGVLPVDVTYTSFVDGRAEAHVKADLAPAVLMIKPFDFEKPVGTSGTATCKVFFNRGAVREIRDLTIESPAVRLSKGRFIFTGAEELSQGEVPRIVFGENDLKLEFETTPSGALKIAIDGAFMDAQPFLNKRKGVEPYDGPPLLASVNVDRMRTHPARLVERAKIYLNMADNGDVHQLEMDAVAGKGDVYFRFKPDDSGKMMVRFEADDAGAALRAFDVYENIEGGTFILYGEAPDLKRNKTLVGTASLKDFHVTQAPVLARLLSGLGPTGVPQLLSNDGIYFGQLEADFEWYIKNKGDLYLIRDGRTSGSSLGLTFDGQIDKAAATIDMSGTIVPMSMLNELVGNIPIIGRILSGGQGSALFAATYTVKGDAEEPEITVNPLSVLAPGIVRKVLFEE